jgi:hypothetical protein
MHSLLLVFFAIAAGFTASGITANLYRTLGFRAQTPAGRVFRSVVLVIAGPSVIFESAVRGFKARTWKPLAFWCTLAGLMYWSLALGLFVLDVGMRL